MLGRNHTFQIQIFLVKQVSKYVNAFRDSVETIERQHQCLCRVCCLGVLQNTVTVFQCYYILALWQFWKPLFIKNWEFWYKYFLFRTELACLFLEHHVLENIPFFFFFLNKRTRIFYSATIITFQLAHSSKNEQFTRVTYAGACLYIFILSPAWKELNRAYKWWIQSVLGYKTTKMG